MQLKIQNLGKISHADIDIRPLTVFIGPNGSNKTWTAYALYGLATELCFSTFSDLSILDLPACEAGGLTAAIDNAIEEVVQELIRDKESETVVRMTRDEILKGLPPFDFETKIGADQLASLLAVDRRDEALQAAKAQLSTCGDDFTAPVFLSVTFTYSPTKGLLVWEFQHSSPSKGVASFRSPLGAVPSDNGTPAWLVDQLRFFVTQSVKRLVFTLIDNAIVIPADRKALFSSETRGISLGRRRGFPPEVELPESDSVTRPVYDFMTMLEVASYGGRSRGERDGRYGELADLLEKQIIQGRIELKKELPDSSIKDENMVVRNKRESARGVFRYAASEGIELGLNSSASIVRSLAGLDVFLRNFCRVGDLIVIDEPEMNAHPDAQLKIIEMLAILANSGVRVVITTHSPYIVDHLCNLMQASRLSEVVQEEAANHLTLGLKNALIKPEMVSTYLFSDDGTVQDVLDRNDATIDLGTFGKTAEYIYNFMANLADPVTTPSE